MDNEIESKPGNGLGKSFPGIFCSGEGNRQGANTPSIQLTWHLGVSNQLRNRPAVGDDVLNVVRQVGAQAEVGDVQQGVHHGAEDHIAGDLVSCGLAYGLV